MRWDQHRFAPAAGSLVCRVEDVPPDNGLERNLGTPQAPFIMVVFRAGPELCGFLNRCPHAGISLNFGDDVFLVNDSDGERDVICPHHSALFRLPSGVCHDGPCVGESLSPVPLEVVDGLVRIAPSQSGATAAPENTAPVPSSGAQP